MLERRAFLASLAALPMLGGGVKLIGQPTATAVPMSDALLANYKGWLAWERFRLHRELYEDPIVAERNVGFLACAVPAEHWHNRWQDEPACPEPSTRAALVLAAVGCPLTKPGQITFIPGRRARPRVTAT